jgi:KDO2-lipid IV(A) lauroyltransferase
MWWASAGRRRVVEATLRRVTGGRLQGAALDRAVRTVFANYGRYWYELFRLPDASPDDVRDGFRIEGFEHVEAAAAEGRGVILALAHLGNYDWAGAWLALQGYPPVVVVEPVEPPELFAWFRSTRGRLGMDVVPLGPTAGAEVGRALEAGRVVCLMSDRDLSGTGVGVEFFGEPTTLPEGPALFALRRGSALLPGGCYLTPDGGHLTVVRPPVPVARAGRLRDDVARVTQRLAHELEDLIRADPEQWLLLQPNWAADRELVEAAT